MPAKAPAPISYSAAYGGIPQVEDPTVSAGYAIGGNLGNWDQIQQLANQYNQNAVTSSVLPYQMNLPNYGAMMGQQSSNIGSQLRGEIPQDVMNLIAQQAAERGIQIGSPGSPNANAAMLRALGLTSIGQQEAGAVGLQRAIGEIPQPKLFDPNTMLVTPEQEQANSVLQSIFSSAPVPEAAAEAAKKTVQEALDRYERMSKEQQASQERQFQQLLAAQQALAANQQAMAALQARGMGVGNQQVLPSRITGGGATAPFNWGTMPWANESPPIVAMGPQGVIDPRRAAAAAPTQTTYPNLYRGPGTGASTGTGLQSTYDMMMGLPTMFNTGATGNIGGGGSSMADDMFQYLWDQNAGANLGNASDSWLTSTYGGPGASAGTGLPSTFDMFSGGFGQDPMANFFGGGGYSGEVGDNWTDQDWTDLENWLGDSTPSATTNYGSYGLDPFASWADPYADLYSNSGAQNYSSQDYYNPSEWDWLYE